MKSIENGVIQRISPSMISAFDASSPFGCARRGWFKYVLGVKEPTTPEMTRGTHLHAMNETYLREGMRLLGTEEQTAWFNAGRPYLDTLPRTALRVEQPMPPGFTVEGIPVSEMSKCDVVTEVGIIDWKTTSDIERYGKTPGQLATDVQMLIYAKAFHPEAPLVTLTHGQYQTKGKSLFRAVSVELTREELDKNYNKVIIPRVAAMREVAKATEAKAVTPNRDACRRCPHQGICPPDKENPLMGIFNRMKQSNTPAPPAVLPPDAPKSDPALAAKPVENFSPVPPPKKHMNIVDVPAQAPAGVPAPAPTAPVTSEPSPSADLAPSEPKKRGPGRPPGAKNKPKESPVVGPLPAPSPPTVAERGSVAFESVTVNYGLTLNLGNFNSARIDCAMTAKFSGNPDVAFAQVLERVKAQVEREIAKVQEAAQLNPGGK